MGRTETTAGAPTTARSAGTPPGPARARPGPARAARPHPDWCNTTTSHWPGPARAARVARGRAPTREIVA